MIENSILEMWRSSRPTWLPVLIALGAMLIFPVLIGVLGFDRAFQIIVQGGAVLVLGLVAIVRPTWVVMALFLILGLFGQQLFIPGIPLNLRGTEVLTIVLLLWWLFEKMLRRARSARSALDVPMAAYCAVLALGVIYGIIAGWEPRVALREGIKLGVIALYFPLKELLYRNPELFARGVVLPIQIGVAISASLAVVSAMAGTALIVLDPYQPDLALTAFDIEGISRLEALVPATSFAFVALISLSQLVMTRKMLFRGALLALTSIAALGILFTFTRTRWLGLALGMSILLVSFARRDRLGDRITLLVVFVPFGIIVWFVPAFVGIDAQAIVTSRLDIWVTQGLDYRGGIHRLNELQAYWNAFLAAPILGQGLGAEVSFYSPGQGVITRTFAHNDYLMLLGKLGIVGLLALIGLVGATFRRARSGFRFQNGGQEQIFAVGLVAFLVSVFVSAISIGGLSNFGTGPLLAVVFAYIAVFGGRPMSSGEQSSST